jgi:outer membrane protein OmpA-like peptidoglycan-associated protein
MLVTGYADSRGKEWPNLLLSAQRAAIVKQALVRRGVPPDRLALRAFGIADFHDADAPAGSENRVVVLTWRLTIGRAR